MAPLAEFQEHLVRRAAIEAAETSAVAEAMQWLAAVATILTSATFVAVICLAELSQQSERLRQDVESVIVEVQAA